MRAEGQRPVRLTAWACLAQALSMAAFSAYPALLPALRQAWGLSGVQAGFIGGAFFFGYMIAVPSLSSLTDRIDARAVFVSSCGVAGAGSIGFAFLAHGALTGAIFQAITGAGLAGTYMPGLKALTDRVAGQWQSRTVAFYTATVGVGVSMSLALSGWLSELLSWRGAFAVLAMGPLAAGGIMWMALVPHPPEASVHRGRWLQLRDAWAHRDVRRYALGYAVHCWELFSLRSWIVGFLVFAGSDAGAATGVAALINLLGLPASVLGNEAAIHFGRVRWIGGVMCASAMVSWLTALAVASPGWILLTLLSVYMVCVMADSAALTAGLVGAAPASQRGAAMAIHSFLGFGAGFLSPMVFGATLDACGGGRLAWMLAFGTLSAGGLVWAAFNRFGPSARPVGK